MTRERVRRLERTPPTDAEGEQWRREEMERCRDAKEEEHTEEEVGWYWHAQRRPGGGAHGGSSVLAAARARRRLGGDDGLRAKGGGWQRLAPAGKSATRFRLLDKIVTSGATSTHTPDGRRSGGVSGHNIYSDFVI